MWDTIHWHAVDYPPRLHCWSSKGEIALLHVIFYCLLRNNVLAYISFYSPSCFLHFLFRCVQALEIHIFFFSVTKNYRKLPLWDGGKIRTCWIYHFISSVFLGRKFWCKQEWDLAKTVAWSHDSDWLPPFTLSWSLFAQAYCVGGEGVIWF